jgi:hypothetical protein
MCESRCNKILSGLTTGVYFAHAKRQIFHPLKPHPLIPPPEESFLRRTSSGSNAGKTNQTAPGSGTETVPTAANGIAGVTALVAGLNVCIQCMATIVASRMSTNPS